MAKNDLADKLNSPINSDKDRSTLKVIKSVRTAEGGDLIVNRAFPTHFISEFDPFLLLDEMGPADHGPGQAKGAPELPHRGFETVTYMLEGISQHKVSNGHTGKLGPGDVQWMTDCSSSGVIHSEIPGDEFIRDDGRMHGFQLWVNLPMRDKMINLHYKEIPNSEIRGKNSRRQSKCKSDCWKGTECQCRDKNKDTDNVCPLYVTAKKRDRASLRRL
jgi:redox-sensitive bicupin YhaK (pirin superfamily)